MDYDIHRKWMDFFRSHGWFSISEDKKQLLLFSCVAVFQYHFCSLFNHNNSTFLNESEDQHPLSQVHLRIFHVPGVSTPVPPQLTGNAGNLRARSFGAVGAFCKTAILTHLGGNRLEEIWKEPTVKGSGWGRSNLDNIVFSRTNCDWQRKQGTLARTWRTSGRGRPKTVWRKRKRKPSESGHPIRLKSVARPNPYSSSKAKAKPKARSSARPLARSFVRGTPQAGLKVHGWALKLNKKIRDLAERWVSGNPTVPYFLESPYQVRHLAANQLKRETGVKGAVAASLVQNLWNSPNVGSTAKGPDEACSSCDDRRVELEPGVAEYWKRRAEAKKKAKASSTAKQ